MNSLQIFCNKKELTCVYPLYPSAEGWHIIKYSVNTMKKNNLFLAIALATAPLMGQDLQQIANNLEIPEVKPGQTRLSLPKANGVTVELLGADYEQIIDSTGKIHPVIDETPVNVSFKVKKDDKEAISRDYVVTLKPNAAKQTAEKNPKPRTIPEILQWKGGSGSYKLGDPITISCSDAELARIFAKDLHAVLGKEVKIVKKDTKADISIEATSGKKQAGDEESYTLSISKKGVIIKSPGKKGRFWGTRTVLQMLKQSPNALACGTAADFPRYKVRGFMFDVARTPYPISYLKQVINAMAWYKMNDLHLVINNNYIFHEHYVDKGRDPFKESYAAFRLESDVKGKDGTPLTAQDLFYTKKEFIDLVKYAAARGVNIVPEFDTPGHALSFTRVRPDLIYKGKMSHDKRRCEMLDAANDETLKFVGGVLDEYLQKDAKYGQAVLGDCPVIHVGADEFFGGKEDYRKYADGILKHALKRGYTPRIWGSLSQKSGSTPVVSKGVQMNLWSRDWMHAWEAVNQGYDVINTNDGALYIVPFANYYNGPLHNRKGIFNNWLPNKIANETLPAGHPQLLGATFAVWNDTCDLLHTGQAPSDIWKMITNTLDVFAQKTWGKATPPESFEDHLKLVETLGEAPGVNPYFQWKDKTPFTIEPKSLPCALKKPAIGPSYRVSMTLKLNEAPSGQEQVLLSGAEGKLIAVMKDGTIGFRRDDSLEFSFGTSLPVGKEVKLELIGEPEKTTLLVNGQAVGTLTLTSFKDKDNNFEPKTKGLRSTFILPLRTLGESFRGTVSHLEVTPQ